MAKLIRLSLGYSALVNNEFFVSLCKFKWSAVRCGTKVYAVRMECGKKIYMHRQIIDADYTQIVDHANGDGLDNRLLNLRLCTKSENAMNMRRSKTSVSGHKGVSLDKRDGIYSASIMLNKKHIHLGRFPNPRDAAIAYDQAAVKYFGKFANLNLPTSPDE